MDAPGFSPAEADSVMHGASRSTDVQWHRLGDLALYDKPAFSDYKSASVELLALEAELNTRAQEILTRHGLADWAVSLHITTTRESAR